MAELKHPQILFASDLRGGDVVLLGAQDWVRDPRKALVARDSEAAQGLERRAKADVLANHVVDVYLADVLLGDDDTPVPLHFREKMRLAGPSVRSDLIANRSIGERDDRA